MLLSILEIFGVKGGGKGFFGTFYAIFTGKFEIMDLVLGIFYLATIYFVLQVLKPLLDAFKK